MDFDAIRAREAAHFLPVVKRFPVALASGSGSRVVDVFGKEYVDLMAGWGVTCIGHSHPTLVRAIAEQAGRLMQTTNIFYTLPQLDLCDRLASSRRYRSRARSSPTRAPRRSKARSSSRTGPPAGRCTCRRAGRFTAARSARSR